jgi:hypothetical protein
VNAACFVKNCFIPIIFILYFNFVLKLRPHHLHYLFYFQ